MSKFNDITSSERLDLIAENEKRWNAEITNMNNDDAIKILLTVMPKHPRTFAKNKERKAYALAIKALKEVKK